MFDPVIKLVSDKYPQELASAIRKILGHPTTGRVEIVQPNLPPATLEADRVYQLADPSPSILHTEWESSSKLGRPDRFHVYNTLLNHQTKLPVKTVVVLLRPEANSSDLTGELVLKMPDETEPYLIWRYRVIRLWEIPPEFFLQEPGLTPFAALGSIDDSSLPDLARRLENVWKKLDEHVSKELKTVTEVLLGLRFDREMIAGLFGEVRSMRESVIYQEILREGRAEAFAEANQSYLDHARKRLLKVGTKKAGEPSAEQKEHVISCTSLDRLDRMLDTALDAKDWASIIATE